MSDSKELVNRLRPVAVGHDPHEEALTRSHQEEADRRRRGVAPYLQEGTQLPLARTQKKRTDGPTP